MVSRSVDSLIRGCAANARVRANLQPQIRHPGRGGAERNRTAHLGPFAAGGNLEKRIVAHTRLQRRHLLIHSAIEQRLDVVRDVDLGAEDGQGRIRDRDLRAQAGLHPPCRQQRRMRRHRDAAADVGALIKFLSLQVLDALPQAAAEQAAKRAREIARVAGDLPSRLKRPSQIGGHGEPIRATGDRQAPTRDGPVHLGIGQQLRQRVVALADEIARRRRLHRVADGGERDRRRRDDDRAPGNRRERRHIDQGRPRILWGGPKPARCPERAAQHDNGNEPANDDLAP